MAQLLKGRINYAKNDFRQAISYYTEGIELKRKDDKQNVKFYLERAHCHAYLGELTRLFLFCFTLVS